MYKTLEEVRAGLSVWYADLKDKIEPLSNELPYKPTFEIEYYRQALLRRYFELVEASIDLYDAKRYIAAITTARAAHETFSVIWYLNIKIKKFLKDRNAKELVEILNRLMHGWAETEGIPEKINILSVINAVDKHIEGDIRKFYDLLSEHAHPNWSGALGAYASTIKEDQCVIFGGYPRLEANLREYIESALIASSGLLLEVQEEYADILNEALELCFELHDNGNLKDQIMNA